ncbi:MAG TPA: 23S rRNA (uracil(1939)-C(5))-methyltransferase RlmD [Geobacteraceae bacterium]|nr:23S rRNA (uracil(1939)-C(5))-methyltransferase RlmD [Geobacteraceae bacterium]
MKEITLKIEKMAFGGGGLGYADGKVCFVPYTAPGDSVRVKIKREKRSYMEGEIEELLLPSPLRETPPCPVFGVCGGCDFQQLSPVAQMEEKQKIFLDIMWRSGRVESTRILPILPASEPYGYRARVQLKVRFIHGELHLGFYRSGTHFVVGIPGNCAIAHSSINHLLPELSRMLHHFPEPDKLPQIDVAVGEDGTTVVIFHYIGENHADSVDFMQKNRALVASASGIYIQSGRKTTLHKVVGTDTLSYSVPSGFLPGIPERSLTFTPGAFSQVNYRQNLSLIATVYDWSGLTGKERLLDVCCGNGNFSIPLAERCGKVLGIEEYAPSIRDAQHNCQLNRLDNIEFRCLDAVAGLKELIANGDTFDVVVLDPPRTGAAEIVKLIPSLKPTKIVYISCDPPTLARDIGMLGKLNYEVVKSQPIDMFPQTHHIESVTLLVPSNNGIYS